MHDIEMHEMSSAFFKCWQAALRHIDARLDGGGRSWLRAHPYPPILEHLSFRLGNQLFFVRVEDADGKVQGPAHPRAPIVAAKPSGGHACVMPMKKSRWTGQWSPVEDGWGLLDARSGAAIDPLSLVSDEKIEMTDWEVHNMGVEIVRRHLIDTGYEMMSWQGDPRANPSIWFIGDSREPEWVVVRATRFPGTRTERPGTWREIEAGCARLGKLGHFASVALVSVDQPFASASEAPVPLWRGHAMHARFEGLE